MGEKEAVASKAGISTYVVVPQGNVRVKTGKTSVILPLSVGKFYSAVWTGETFKLMTDSNADDRAKALLTIYNLSKVASLDLKTADGKLAVISGVKPGESGNRAVNGITVDLAVFNGNKAVATFKAVALAYSGRIRPVIPTKCGCRFRPNAAPIAAPSGTRDSTVILKDDQEACCHAKYSGSSSPQA